MAANEGDLVLNSFLGSGTTAAAAQKMRSCCIGIEMGIMHIHIARYALIKGLPERIKVELLHRLTGKVVAIVFTN